MKKHIVQVAVLWVSVLVGLSTAGCSTGLPRAEEDRTNLVGCAKRRILSTEGARLVEYDSSGKSTDRFVFGADPDKSFQSIAITVLQQAGPRVVAVAQRNELATGEQTDEVVLLDGSDVVFHTILRRSPTTAFLNAAGDLTLGGAQTLVRRADGTLIDLGEYTPIGPVYDDTVMVSIGQLFSPNAPVGRLRIAGNEGARGFELFADRAISSAPVWTATQFLYVSGGVLIAASAHDTKRIALPLPFDGTRQIVQVGGERFVLLGAAGHLGLELVDLDTGTITSLPQEATGFRQELETAAVDDHGRVYGHIASANDKLTLMRTENGTTYTTMGIATAAHDEGGERFLRAVVHGDRALVLNLSLENAEGGVAMERVHSVQLAGVDQEGMLVAAGDYQTKRSLDPAPYGLSQDGACVAAWVRNADAGFALVVVDQGGRRTLRESAEYSAIRFAE